MEHEVDTYNIITDMLRDNKHVFVPETDYINKTMHFKALLNLDNIGLDDKGSYIKLIVCCLLRLKNLSK